MDQIAPNFYAKVGANGTGVGLCWVGGAHGAPGGVDGVYALQNQNGYRARCDIRYQGLVKGFSFVHGIMPLSQVSGNSHKLQGHNAKATTFEAMDDLTNKTSLYCVGFDDDQRAFQWIAP
jgi:hypothetical protein